MAALDGRDLGGAFDEGRDRIALLLIGLVFALAFSGLTFTSAKVTLVAAGGTAGVVALMAALVLAARRTADLLFVGFAFLVTLPIDKYFDYRAHVGGWPGVRLSVADLVLLLLVPLALSARLLDRSRRGLPATLLILLALTIAQYSLSLLGSPRRDLSLLEIASTVHALSVAWVVAVLFRRRHLPWVIAALALQVWLHTGFALAQAATGRPIGAGIFGGRGEVMTEALATGADLVRPSGLFVHPIVYADFLVLTMPLMAAALLAARRWQARLPLAATLAVGAAGLALTLSRGAWAAALVGAAILVGLGIRRRLIEPAVLRRIVQVAVGGALMLALVFGPRIYERLTASQAGNLDVRFDLNRIALRMIASRPLTGQGLNAFVEVMERFDPKNVMAYFPAPAHNLYLLEAAEAGLPALALLLAVYASVLLGGFRAVGRIADRDLAWALIALPAGIAALLVSQVADFSLRLEPLRTYVWFLVGLLVGVQNAGRHAAETDPEGADGLARWGATMAAAEEGA